MAAGTKSEIDAPRKRDVMLELVHELVSEGRRAFIESSQKQDAPRLGKRIRFVRHAETESNVDRLNRGGQYVPDGKDMANTRLTAAGRSQAATLKLDCDLLIVSPLRRCLETYIHSCIRIPKAMVVCDFFREMRTDWASAFELEDFKVETADEFRSRMEACLDFLRQRKESDILVLGHRLALAPIVAQLTGRVDFLANVEVQTANI